MNDDPELQALSAVVAALQGLDREAQERVLAYVSRKLGIAQASDFAAIHSRERVADPNGNEPEASQSFSDQDNLDGVSPIAKKWIRRSGLATEQLGQLFSLGVDEIDVVAKTIPGKGKKNRMRSVALLKGLASYLSSGVPRVTAEQIKEACLHYDAYDAPHHAENIKAMASELNGTKSDGYTLTARGITAGTELVKKMLGITNETK
jgi:hypothetical protein